MVTPMGDLGSQWTRNTVEISTLGHSLRRGGGGENKGHLCFLVASLGTGRGDFFHVAILPFALNKKARFML